MICNLLVVTDDFEGAKQYMDRAMEESFAEEDGAEVPKHLALKLLEI